MRDFHLSWDVVVGSLAVLVVLCGAWSVSNPQPPLRREDGCAVDFDRDPPVRRAPSRQDDGNVRAPALVCVVAACVLHCARGHVCWWIDCGVVLSDSRTLPRTVPLALSFDLGRSRDSTFPIQGIVFVKSASSFTFGLCEGSWAPVVGSLTGQHFGLVFSLAHPHYRRNITGYHLPQTPERLRLASITTGSTLLLPKSAASSATLLVIVTDRTQQHNVLSSVPLTLYSCPSSEPSQI